MTATLPEQIQSVFERFRTTELTTVDADGQPITWPVTPRYRAGAPCIDVHSERADEARANTQVGLLFCDGTGSGLASPPVVLVQGTAQVDPSAPGAAEIHIRPERVYVWPEGNPGAEPRLYDAHMEEVRSGHSEEPEHGHAAPAGGAGSWDPRLEALGGRSPSAILSVVSPDGFPFAARVRVAVDPAQRRVVLAQLPAGLPLAAGRACLATDVRDDPSGAGASIQVRGDLVPVDGGWALIPHSVAGGEAAGPPPGR